jgi:hypothetical protein
MILWRMDDAYLTAFGKTIACSCRVRNEINGMRLPNQVVYSERADGELGVPYYPRQFPRGKWNVYHPVPRTDHYMAPYFIPTDAHQLVEEWSIKQEDGTSYDQKTGRAVEDFGYGLHHSSSPTTLGCIKIESLDDLGWLVKRIQAEMADGRSVELEVA